MAGLFHWELLFSPLWSCRRALPGLLITTQLARTERSFVVVWEMQSCATVARQLIGTDSVENLLADKYFWEGLCQEMWRRPVKKLPEAILKIVSLGSCPGQFFYLEERYVPQK